MKRGRQIHKTGPLAILLAVLGGCGGGGSSTSSDSGSTTTTVAAPTIGSQPASLTVTAGASATFSVVATGSGTLSYQWFKGSTAISGATAASYTIASTAAGDAGSYDVVVTGSGVSTTSATATLTVNAASGTTTTASCDTTHITTLMSAVSAFESALGSSLTASMAYDAASNSSAQLNVYKTRWSNLPPGALAFTRPGIALSQVTTSAQVAAFNTLAQAALSSSGYADMQGVLAADDYLGYTLNANGYGAGLARVAVIGTPSSTGSWALMFGGHHLAFNLSFNGGCTYPTPHHIGVEPRTAFTANSQTGYNFYGAGSYQVLSSKAAGMLAVFNGLSSSEKSSAFLTSQTFGDILLGPVEANTGSYANVSTKLAAVAASSKRGLLVTSLSTAEQALVTAAIQQWVGDYDNDTAARLLADYQADYASTYVAWANSSGSYSSDGPDASTNGSYMRIDGPRVWIEIAVQNGVIVQSQTHYHMVYRDKTLDYFNELAN
ncbi:DUF3500 domain-containing protein [Paucibacter sp. R3-3]|uniref:DUF3500 domain-containing protein n=1 Tax=Roseateles agri TaxID=3098619 RepID=A0ABU5DL46_9BURK|nr:DUF3500 domain-containing protein [Paucibacter sp. R3-3]MDY0747035.1 DUF3500 domain-containing protein [Paucibacter sp. R3-3]